MFALADVDTDEHVDAFVVLDHDYSVHSKKSGLVTASSPGIHVTNDLGTSFLVEPLLAITRRQSGPVTTPPGSWATGGNNHAGPDRPTPLQFTPLGPTNKVTGPAAESSKLITEDRFCASSFRTGWRENHEEA